MGCSLTARPSHTILSHETLRTRSGLLTSFAVAQQPAIFVDVGSASFGFGVPSPGYSAAASIGGQWNGLDSDLFTGLGLFDFTSPPLIDINGATTGVTLTYDSLGFGFLDLNFDEVNTFGNDEALMDDISYVSGPSELLSLIHI